jgi:hypothetical protein
VLQSPNSFSERFGAGARPVHPILGHRVAVLELIATATGVRSGDQIFAMLMPDEHARDEVSSKVDMVRLDRESARPQVVFTFFSRLLSPPA